MSKQNKGYKIEVFSLDNDEHPFFRYVTSDYQEMCRYVECFVDTIKIKVNDVVLSKASRKVLQLSKEI